MRPLAPDLLELRNVNSDPFDGFLTHSDSIRPLIAISKEQNNIFCISMTFGQKLKAWREAARLKQTELAARAKISVPYLSNLERDFSSNTRSGKPRASEDVCKRLAKALDVPLDEVRLSAGWKSEHPIEREKPKTVQDLLSRLEELGVGAQFFGGIESLPDDPETLSAILQDIETVLALRARRTPPHNESNPRGLRPE